MVSVKSRTFAFAALVAGLVLSACSKDATVDPPPRADDAIEIPPQSSIIAVPVTADISQFANQLEREVPKTLWSINRKGMTCVASEKVKVAFVKIKTPNIKCDIVGTVTRGKMRLSGRGQDIVVTMPIHAVVQAKDIAGVFKQETATADAVVRAVVRLSLTKDWNPRGMVNIEYGWTREPGIDFLGQRIEFTKTADKGLQKVERQIEQSLSREIAKLKLRNDIERLWGMGFTSLQLNRSNPPVWMRIAPEQLQFGGYTISGRTLTLRLGMKAHTDTFVGDRPADPPKIPLPPLAKLEGKAGELLFFIPVIADYAQLEPVLHRALVKRSARPFDVPGTGPLTARFDKVQIYGTTGGRIAVGVTFAVKDDAGNFGEADGAVWATAVPTNAENSREVHFTDFTIVGDTNRTGADLALKLASSPGFAQTIGDALTQNFERDYSKLMVKIDNAIAERQEGDLLIRARIENARTGQIKAAGQGVYLPVWGTGSASISLRPQ